MDFFLDKNLGTNVYNRQEWLQRNSFIAKELFQSDKEQFIAIADGTYCYIQKSSNNYFQRVTYSGQKKRHLVKPFIICTSDGHIIDVFGLFQATKNDAEIILEIFENNLCIRELFREGDILLLDRGFRDAMSSKYKLNTKMPSLIKNGENQLTTEEANKSRCVTKCRWVVEVINSFSKRYLNLLKK